MLWLPQVAVKLVMALPPLLPAVKGTLTLFTPADTVPMVGAEGTVRGVTLPVTAPPPVPAALVAVTVKV